MGLFTAITDLFKTEEPARLSDGWDIQPPSAKATAKEVEVNPSNSAQYERYLGRLLNLYTVRNPSEEVLAEIRRYKFHVNGLGFDAPQDREETQIHLDLLKG